MSDLRQTLQARSEALCERGGERFDGVGMRHVQRLCERAATLPEAAETHLLTRALRYLEQLEQHFDAESERTAGELERLRALGLDGEGALGRAYRDADFTTVHRVARRHPWSRPRAREAVRQRWEASVDAEAEKRGLSSPGLIEVAAPPAQREGTDAGGVPGKPAAASIPAPRDPGATVALAMAIYRDAAAATSAKLAIRRARRSLPPEAGRYHAASVATHALQALQITPGYLEAQLARLEVAALLEAFGAPPPAPPRKRARRKRADGR